MRNSNLFDKTMADFFGPIAQRLHLSLVKVEDGIYEIPSQHFVLRIRLHTGHARGMNVMLRPASVRDFDENEPGVHYGIGCFMEFNGEKLEQVFIEVGSDDEFVEHAHARRLILAWPEFTLPINQFNYLTHLTN